MMPTIIDLTEGPSMRSGKPSSVRLLLTTVESQFQVKMSGGMLRLQCRAGGRITTGGYINTTMKSR
jgi:hypothetical protein